MYGLIYVVVGMLVLNGLVKRYNRRMAAEKRVYKGGAL